MSYQSFPYNGFGLGLNLRDKPDAIDQQECVDCLNVDFSERGSIVTRGGYEKRATMPIKSLGSYENTSGLKRLLVFNGSTVGAYTTAGTATTTFTPTDLTRSFIFARHGTPNLERVYLSNGVDIRYYNGSSFTNPGSSFPKGENLCVQNTDNRLVSCGFVGANDGPGGATSSPSHVYFSDPGDPATWPANNFVQLTPGDGEKIMGAFSWRELTFVFKETRFFVFYGNSVDAGGQPIFNYRPVDVGAGLAARHGIAVGVDGVYFVGKEGLYRTEGAAPTRVSDRVAPLWTGRRSGYYTGGVIDDYSKCVLTSYEQRIYMGFPTGTTFRILVHDPIPGWFGLYGLPGRFVHGFDGGLWFGDTFLARGNRTTIGDDGVPVEAFWQSGWNDFGNPDMKVVRKGKMWGAGKVFFGLGTDFEESSGPVELVDFGQGPQGQPQWNSEQWNDSTWAEPRGLRGLSAKQWRRSNRGTTFSTLIQGAAPWAVHRIDHLVRQVRQPGIEDA